MAKTSSTLGNGVVINGDKQPRDADPHSWLPLVGDPPSSSREMRILYGVLRPEYRGRVNSAEEFIQRKVAVVPTPGGDPWAVTAARAETLLPGGTDDRFACPRALAEAVDRERPATRQVLFTYVTITVATRSLHEQYELVRAYAAQLVRELGVGIIVVQHAPHRAGSDSPHHCHLAITRKVTCLGLAGYVEQLCGDKERQFIVDSFTAFRAAWPG